MRLARIERCANSPFPLPPKAAALPRALQSAAHEKDATPMRHPSHLFVIAAVPPIGAAPVSWLVMQDDLVRAVSEELRWGPRIDADRVRVSAKGRTITLSGTVRSYSAKCCAEKIAREIRGVVDVKNELEVRLSIGSYRTDAGLERLTSDILQNHTALCDPLPCVTVRDGWLTLQGVVTSDVQKRCAEAALRDVSGIRGITNNTVVAPAANSRKIRHG
jgi:osmotically-inducible protein OsmY